VSVVHRGSWTCDCECVGCEDGYGHCRNKRRGCYFPRTSWTTESRVRLLAMILVVDCRPRSIPFGLGVVQSDHPQRCAFSLAQRAVSLPP